MCTWWEFITINEEQGYDGSYLKLCEQHLGVTPEFDCNEGVLIPVTVDGEEIWYEPPLYECDHYSLQAGQCTPGSTVNRFTGRKRSGEELPNVVWIAFCRTQFSFDATLDNPFYDNGVQVIGYNYDTGATCFLNGVVTFGVHDGSVQTEEAWKAKGKIPSSADPNFKDELAGPGPPPCVMCHTAYPFIHNKWVDQARLPENPDEPVIPVITDANPPYWTIGHNDWDLRTIYIEGNACLTCHRVNMGLIGLFNDNHWDINLNMPPYDPGSLTTDYEKLLQCWENSPENTSDCYWTIPPGGGCAGGIVDDDYPYVSSFTIPGPEDNPE